VPFSCSLCAEFSAHAENLKGEPMALRRFSEEEARERHRARVRDYQKRRRNGQPPRTPCSIHDPRVDVPAAVLAERG